MGGKIEIYLDVASFYSYIAFVQLLKSGPLLQAHGVELDIKPVFLGAMNAGSGNKPPWTVPAKAAHSMFELNRATKAVGLQDIHFPEDLMVVGRTILPLRALHYIKQNYPRQTYLITWHYLLHSFWGTPQRKVNEAEELAAALAETPSGFLQPRGGSEPLLFTKAEVDAIMAATQDKKFKDVLKETVDEALERGAFGAPWLWVTNDGGESEPFFGSDRWHYVYEFLGLPYQDVALLPPGQARTLVSKL